MAAAGAVLLSRYCFGSSGFPNVLMLTVHNTTHTPLHLRPSSSRTTVRRHIAAFMVATCTLYPASLLASEATPPLAPASAELAALDRNEVPFTAEPRGPVKTGSPTVTAAPAEIRIKLHGIEDLSAPAKKVAEDNTLEEVKAAVHSDTDELKKQAQVKYLAAKLKKHERAVRKYVDLAWAEASKRQELDPELLIAIIKKESAFRPQVQSSYGAQGLMQVVRRWHRDKLHPSESLFDPEVNIRVGADVLEEYLALAGGNLDTALRKYSGNARGYVNTVLKETRTLARVGEQAATQAQVAAHNARRKG